MAATSSTLDLLLNKAVAMANAGRIAEALPLFEQTVRVAPRNAALRFYYGNALRLMGRLAEAVAEYERTIKLDGTILDARMNAALGYCELHQPRKALVHAQAILERIPQHAGAVLVSGMAIGQLGDDAKIRHHMARYLDRLLEAPVPPGAEGERHCYALGTICAVLKRTDLAAKYYVRAGSVPQALSRALRLKEEACDWRDNAELIDAVLRQAKSNPAMVEPFRLLSISDDPRLHQNVCQAAAPVRKALPARPVGPETRRLRIAYLSADFHAHATAYLMADVLNHHDRELFDIHLYSYGPDDGSRWRKQLQGGNRFVDLREMSDFDAAARIAADQVDVLIELKGFTKDHRLGIAAQRPAPIQVNWLGFPGTLGMPAIDYIIADGALIEPGEEGAYSEAVVRMPVTYQPASRDRASPLIAAADKPDANIILTAFNQPYKIGPRLFSIWCKLLRHRSDAALWLYAPTDDARANLRLAAAGHGVDPDRLAFAEHADLKAHLARYRHSVLQLDTWPYSGHTTTSDALLMNCPVLTLRGHGFPSRVGASLVAASGLEDFVCNSEDEYESKARHFLDNLSLLDAARAKLAGGSANLLFDPSRFCKELESAFTTMVERKRRGEPATSFSVPFGG